MKRSLSKLLRQNLSDAVKLRRDVSWRDADDLANRNGIQIFEIQKHELPVEGLQTVDQRKQAFDGHLLIHDTLTVGRSG